LDSFPSLRRELHDREYSIYHLFFDLLPMARDAHETADLATLTRIYAFAEWCSVQHARDLWNAAAVAFYEHVFDERTHAPWEQIVPWLAPASSAMFGPYGKSDCRQASLIRSVR
jgi:hypothetical protein